MRCNKESNSLSSSVGVVAASPSFEPRHCCVISISLCHVAHSGSIKSSVPKMNLWHGRSYVIHRQIANLSLWRVATDEIQSTKSFHVQEVSFEIFVLLSVKRRRESWLVIEPTSPLSWIETTIFHNILSSIVNDTMPRAEIDPESTYSITPTSPTSSASRLTNRNYLNIMAYVLNVVVTYGIGVGGIFDLPTNDELSAKYQTLVTPIGWAFAIWGV